MRKHITGVLFLIALFYSVQGYAQNTTVTISGRITSFEESLPLEGVNVRAKTGDAATGTLPDGSFSLPVGKEEKILVVCLAGYERKEITLTGARDYDIVLKRSGAFTRVLSKQVITNGKK